jgi:hypothetical protein
MSQSASRRATAQGTHVVTDAKGKKHNVFKSLERSESALTLDPSIVGTETEHRVNAFRAEVETNPSVRAFVENMSARFGHQAMLIQISGKQFGRSDKAFSTLVPRIVVAGKVSTVSPTVQDVTQSLYDIVGHDEGLRISRGLIEHDSYLEIDPETKNVFARDRADMNDEVYMIDRVTIR